MLFAIGNNLIIREPISMSNFLSQLSALNILLKKDEDQKSCAYTEKPLSYYLPDAFKPQNFDQKEKGLMEAEFHHLSIASKETLAQAALGGKLPTITARGSVNSK
jgi:hypothetical protein